MSGLLAAQIRSAAEHLFQYVAVAHRDARQAQAFALEHAFQAEIRHCCADHAAAVQLAHRFQVSCDGEKHTISIHMLAAGAYEHGAVGIAIEGHAQGGMRLEYFLAQIFRMHRPAAVVDILSIGLIVNRDHIRAKRTEQSGPKLAGRAVGAIEYNPHP